MPSMVRWTPPSSMRLVFLKCLSNVFEEEIQALAEEFGRRYSLLLGESPFSSGINFAGAVV